MKNRKPYNKVNIEISNICNLQCSFCPEVIRPKELMDLALFEKIVSEIAPLTNLICFHLMGEPLVHPKLKEMILICEKYDARIFFVTNGILLKEIHHEMLTHPAFYQVNFSLHSFFDNHPGKDPITYLNKIFTWTDYALKHRPDLYINFRLWNLQDTRGQINENQKMLEKIKARYHFEFNPGKIDVTKHKSFPIMQRLYLHFDTEFIWPDLNLPILGTKGTCYGMNSHFGVLVDGTFVPCCLDKEGVIELGNIRQQSLNDILQSERVQNILQGFKNRRLVEDLCQRCQYIERFN